MNTTRPSDRGEDNSAIPTETLNALIGRHVVRSLGSPGDLLKVQVRPLGSDHYRVNIIVGKNAASPRIADSFFLTADGAGNILSSSPEIVKAY